MLFRILCAFTVLAGCVLFLQQASAACVDNGDGTWTTTPDYADVSSCVSSAERGDVIHVTAGGSGSATWSSTLYLNRGVSLVGPGKSALTINVGATLDNVIHIQPDSTARANDAYMRVSGFSIHHNSQAVNESLIQVVNVSSPVTPSTKIRIDNMTLTNATGLAMVFRGYVGGVGHDLELNTVATGAKTFEWLGHDYGGAGGLSACQWEVPLGSDSFFYIEDSQIESITSQSMTSGGWGGKRGFRFNTVDLSGCSPFISVFDIHGDTTWPGMTHNEIYRNEITYGCNNFGIHYKGGKGVVFDNTFIDTGSHTGGGISGVFEPCAQACCTKINDSYFVGNTNKGALNVLTESTADLTEDADYWNEKAFFDGTTGIGRGDLAQRPSTCTTGVSYWATDQGSWNQSGSSAQGVLYKCTSTDTWELYYTPLTYPHPLRNQTDPTPLPDNPSSSSSNGSGCFYVELIAD